MGVFLRGNDAYCTLCHRIVECGDWRDNWNNSFEDLTVVFPIYYCCFSAGSIKYLFTVSKPEEKENSMLKLKIMHLSSI